MSFWDNMTKFAQPYADDEYDDYEEEDDYVDDYDEPEERPARRAPRRAPAPMSAPMDEMDDDAEDEDNYSFPPITPSVSTSSAPAASSGFGSTGLGVSSASSSNRQEVVLFRPASFNDTSKAADDLRNRKAVIVNMENVDKAMARRVVDFLSGCVYALDGDVKKIAQSAYLFCPHNMNIVGDLETLQAEVESYI